MMKFLKTPKGTLLVILILLAAIAGFNPDEAAGGYLNAGVAVLTAVALDLLFAVLLERKRLLPDGAILTGLIIAMVLSSSAHWYEALYTSAIAITSKHLLRVKKKPIFNPAAVGLLVAIALFSSGQSWWGGLSLLPAWCAAFVIVGGFWITQRINKFPLVFSFLGAYCLLALLLGLFHVGLIGDALRNPFLNSALFLGFFMLTDPPTSPASYKHQVVFGLLAAVTSVADYAVLNGLSYLLAGLLLANAWNAVRIWRTA